MCLGGVLAAPRRVGDPDRSTFRDDGVAADISQTGAADSPKRHRSRVTALHAFGSGYAGLRNMQAKPCCNSAFSAWNLLGRRYSFLPR